MSETDFQYRRETVSKSVRPLPSRTCAVTVGRQKTDKHVIHIKRNGKRTLRLDVKGEVVAGLGKEAVGGLAYQGHFN